MTLRFAVRSLVCGKLFFQADDDETRIRPDSQLAEWIAHLQEQKLQLFFATLVRKFCVEFAIFSLFALLTGPISLSILLSLLSLGGSRLRLSFQT